MIYEIRNYYFEPRHLNAYKAWAKNKAMGYLKREFKAYGIDVKSRGKRTNEILIFGFDGDADDCALLPCRRYAALPSVSPREHQGRKRSPRALTGEA